MRATQGTDDAERLSEEEVIKRGAEDLDTWLNENRERALWHRNQQLENESDVDKQIAIMDEIEKEKASKIEEIKRLRAQSKNLLARTEQLQTKRQLTESKKELKHLKNQFDQLFDQVMPDEREYLANISAAYKRFANLCQTLKTLVQTMTERAKEEATKIPINLNLNITSLCDGKQIESAVIRRRKTSYLQQYRTVRTDLLAQQSQFEAFEDAARYLLSEVSDETISVRFDEVMRSYEILNRSLENRARTLEAQIAQYERYAKTFKTAYDLVLQLDSRVTQLEQESSSTNNGSSDKRLSGVEASRLIRRIMARVQEMHAMRDPGQELVDTAVTGNERVLNLLNKAANEQQNTLSQTHAAMAFDESDTVAIRNAHEETLVSERSQLVAKWQDIWKRLQEVNVKVGDAQAQYNNAAPLAEALNSSLAALRARLAKALDSPASVAEKQDAVKKLLAELDSAAREYLDQLREMGDASQYEAACDDLRGLLERSLQALKDADPLLNGVDALARQLDQWLDETAKAHADIPERVNASVSGRDRTKERNAASEPTLSDSLQKAAQDAEALHADADSAGRRKLQKLADAVDDAAAKLGVQTAEVLGRKQHADRLHARHAKLSADLDQLRRQLPATLDCSRALDATRCQLQRWLDDANDSLKRRPDATASDNQQQLAHLRKLLANADAQRATVKQLDAQTNALLQTLPPVVDRQPIIDSNLALLAQFDYVQSRLADAARAMETHAGQRKVFDVRCDAMREMLAAHAAKLQQLETQAANTYDVHPVPGYLMQVAQAVRTCEEQAELDANRLLDELQALAEGFEKEPLLIDSDVQSPRKQGTELRRMHADLHQRGLTLLASVQDAVKNYDRVASARAALDTRQDDLEARLERLKTNWHSRQAQRDRKSAEQHCSAWIAELTDMGRNVQELVENASQLRNRRMADEVADTRRRHQELARAADQLLDALLADNRELDTLHKKMRDTDNWLHSAGNSLLKPSLDATRSTRHASPFLSATSDASVNGNGVGQVPLDHDEMERAGRKRLDDLEACAARIYLKMNADESARVKEDIAAMQDEFARLLRACAEGEAARNRLGGELRRFEKERKRLEDAVRGAHQQLDSFSNVRPPNDQVFRTLRNLQKALEKDNQDVRALQNSAEQLRQAGLIDSATRDAVESLADRVADAVDKTKTLLVRHADPEGTYEAWHADYRKCVAAVDKVEKKVADNTDRVLRHRGDRQQLVAECQRALDRAKRDRDDLRRRLDQDGPVCTEERRALMQRDMNRLARKFDRVRSALRDFKNAVDRPDASVGWQIFDQLANALNAWLAEAEKAVTFIGAPAQDSVSRQLQTAKLKELQQKLQERRADVEQLEETFREANAAAPDADKLPVLMDIRTRSATLADAISQACVVHNASSSRLSAYLVAFQSCEKTLLQATSELMQLSRNGASSRAGDGAGITTAPVSTVDRCELAIRTLNAVSSSLPSLDEQVRSVAQLGAQIMATQRDDLLTTGQIEKEVAQLDNARNRVRVQCAQLLEEYSALLSQWRLYFAFVVDANAFLANQVPLWLESNANAPASETECQLRLTQALTLSQRTSAIANDLKIFSKLHFVTVNSAAAVDAHTALLAKQLDLMLPKCQSLLDNAVRQLNTPNYRASLRQPQPDLRNALNDIRQWIASAENDLYCAIEDRMTNTKADKGPIERLRAAIPSKRSLLQDLRRSAEPGQPGQPTALQSAFDELASDLDKLSESIDQHLEADDTSGPTSPRLKESPAENLTARRTVHSVSATPVRFSAQSAGRTERLNGPATLRKATSTSNLTPTPTPAHTKSRTTPSPAEPRTATISLSASRDQLDDTAATRDAASQTIKSRKVQTDYKLAPRDPADQALPLSQSFTHSPSNPIPAATVNAQPATATVEQMSTMLQMMRGLRDDINRSTLRNDRYPSPLSHQHADDQVDTCNVCGSLVTGASLANSRMHSRMQSPTMSQSQLALDDSGTYTPSRWPSLYLNEQPSNGLLDSRNRTLTATRPTVYYPISTLQDYPLAKVKMNGTLGRFTPSNSSPVRPGSADIFAPVRNGLHAPARQLRTPVDFAHNTASPYDRLDRSASHENYALRTQIY